jgi:hypothetical protein
VNAIRASFLKAKHWHIFVLLFVIPQIASFAAIVAMQNMFFIVVTIAFGLGLLAWYWSVGSFLSSGLKTQFRMKPGFFHFAVLYPIFYVPVFSWFAFSSGNEAAVVVVPLHLLAMACMVYVLYFVSRSLVTAETGKPASFSDYIGALMLFWFFPIGVWFVQPKVNQLYRRGSEYPVNGQQALD